PNRASAVAEISRQIRTQLEEYAGVALHPLFHTEQQVPAPPPPTQAQTGAAATPAAAPTNGITVSTPRASAVLKSREDSPMSLARGLSRPDTPAQTGGPATPTPAPNVTAEATPILPDSDDYNPDDTYRCVVNL